MANPCNRAKRLRQKVKDDLAQIAALEGELYSRSAQRIKWPEVGPENLKRRKPGQGSVRSSDPATMSRPKPGRATDVRKRIDQLAARARRNAEEAYSLWTKYKCVGTLDGRRRRR